MVIRPMLTYGSIVWWPMVRYKVSKAELSRLQRLATLVITETMRMASTVAMKVLLGLPPLHVMIEGDAPKGIYRMMCTQQWILTSTNFGYAGKYQDMEHEPILQMGNDWMKPIYA
jgi:hypothetical protein